MLRSMYSGISGMRVNQTKLDVTGNNIANVGTTGFNKSRVRFQDMLSQNVRQATGPGRNNGGINPSQVGLGVQVAGIDTMVSQGNMQPTARNLDAAVDGTGYFMVALGEIPGTNGESINVDPTSNTMSSGDLRTSYTRDGSFTLDYEGNLLTSDGYRVLGYQVREKTGPNSATLSVDYDKNGYVGFVDVDSEEGLVNTGSIVPLKIPDSVHVYPDNIPNYINMKFTGNGDVNKLDMDGDPSNGIDGHVQVNTNGFKFAGPNDVSIEFKYGDPDNDGNPTWGIFANGNYITDDPGPIYVHDDGTIDTNPGTDEGIDYTQINFNNPGSVPTGDESKYSWSFTLTAEKDKKIRSFSIEKDGMIKSVLEDGSVSALGQIAMASFKNPAGLEKVGKNLLKNTANSGEPLIRSGVGTPKTQDNSDGYGDMLQGMLEMSNVDLAEEFTDMIVATRAFQASGKMISTGDEILQDIINLKR